MPRRPLLDYALVACLAAIGGYVVGGVVWARTADAALKRFTDFLYDYQALIGGFFALIAAGVAYVAITRQIAADEDRFRRQRTDEQIAMADAISSLLIVASTTLQRQPLVPLPAYLVDECIRLLVDATRIDPRLGTSLNAFVRDVGALSQPVHPAQQAGRGSAVALRGRILTDAFQVASVDLQQERRVRREGLLSREAVLARIQEYNLDLAAAGWFELLLTERL